MANPTTDEDTGSREASEYTDAVIRAWGEPCTSRDDERSEARMPYVDTNGISLYYEVHGGQVLRFL